MERKSCQKQSLFFRFWFCCGVFENVTNEEKIFLRRWRSWNGFGILLKSTAAMQNRMMRRSDASFWKRAVIENKR